MGLHDNYRQVTNLRQYMNNKRDEEHKFKSRLRLSQALNKKFNTCFIGAINSVENTFGAFWGKDLEPNQRTPNQIKILKLWIALRNEILDKGNAQLRKAVKELEDYEINYKGKQIIFTNGDDE